MQRKKQARKKSPRKKHPAKRKSPKKLRGGKGNWRISDRRILALLHSGILIVDANTGEVWYNDTKLKTTYVGTEGDNGTRHRIEICYGGRKRSIVLSRLVYMSVTRKPIPSGREIHHIDGDRYNDTWNNLICVSVEDHFKLHGKNPPAESPDRPPTQSDLDDIPF